MDLYFTTIISIFVYVLFGESEKCSSFSLPLGASGLARVPRDGGRPRTGCVTHHVVILARSTAQGVSRWAMAYLIGFVLSLSLSLSPLA